MDNNNGALNVIADVLDANTDVLRDNTEVLNNNTSALRSLRDLVQEALANSGTENASGVQVTIGTAQVVNIISDADPNLDRQVDPATVSVKPVQSAGAGLR